MRWHLRAESFGARIGLGAGDCPRIEQDAKKTACQGATGRTLYQHNARYNEGSNRAIQEKPLWRTTRLYKAEYLGSGTFVISKPKRKKIKVRQSQLKNPQRGSRK